MIIKFVRSYLKDLDPDSEHIGKPSSTQPNAPENDAAHSGVVSGQVVSKFIVQLVKFSKTQNESQPSPLKILPSSHSSPKPD